MFALMVLWVATPTFAHGQEWQTEILESRGTAQGILQIVHVGEDGYRLMLDGRLLRELEGYRVSIGASFPSDNAPEYLLLIIDTGGGSCPQEYRLLDLTPGRKPFLTGEFGNCSVMPSLQRQDQDVRIDFPPSEGTRAQTWVYKSEHHGLTNRID